MEVWREGYNCAVRERSHPRLTSQDVRDAIGRYSFSLENFYHLSADALNRILDEKEKTNVDHRSDRETAKGHGAA